MGITEDDSESFAVTVEDDKMPAKGIIGSYSAPTKVRPGEPIVVQVIVQNTGEQSGNFSVKITQSGTEKANTGVFTLTAGGNVPKAVSFAAPSTAGTTTYVIRLNRTT